MTTDSSPAKIVTAVAKSRQKSSGIELGLVTRERMHVNKGKQSHITRYAYERPLVPLNIH